MPSMGKYQIMKTILALLSIFVFCLSGQATAQSIEPWPKDGVGLEIYNSNSTWAGQGNFNYEFIIDTQGLFSIDILEISNLVIESNFGEITCPNNIDGSEAGRYPTCTLTSQLADEVLIISSVTGTINGKQYNLLRNIAISDFKPLEIAILSQ